MSTPIHRRKSSRGPADAVINVRLPASMRETIDDAAAVIGKTRSEFVLESAHQHAVDVLLDQRLFSLAAPGFDAFLRVLDAPPEPPARLRKLLEEKSPWET